MSWANLDPRLRETAERVLTEKQMEVFRLLISGYGYKRAALVLHVSPDTVRGHWRAAERKLMRELGDDLEHLVRNAA